MSKKPNNIDNNTIKSKKKKFDNSVENQNLKVYSKHLDVRYLTQTDEVEFISTGISELDKILGGGWPRGKTTLLYGVAGAGKSTILLQSISEYQRLNPNKQILYIDSESALNPRYLRSMNIDLTRLMVYQSVIAEDVLDTIYETCLAKNADIIILDSLASLVAASDIETSSTIRDNTVASLSRVLASNLKKLLDVIRSSQIAVLFTTQCRSNINSGGYGPTTTPAGGMAVLHICSTIVELKRESFIKNSNKIVGFNAKIKCIKNRFADPYQEIILPLTYGKGLDKEVILFNDLLENNIIKQKGIWFYFNDITLGQGKENAMNKIFHDQELLSEIQLEYDKIVNNNQEDTDHQEATNNTKIISKL